MGGVNSWDLFGVVSSAVVVIGPDGLVRYMNPPAEALFGYDLEEIIGQPVERLVPESLESIHRRHRKEYLAQPSKRAMGATLALFGRHKDGHSFPVRVNLSPFQAEGLPEVICEIQDASEVEAAETTARVQRAALRAVANAILITDRQGDIIWANSAFTDLTGYQLEEVVGRSPRILKSGLQDQEFYTGMWDTILAGEVWRDVLVNRHKDGGLYTEEMTITPVSDEDGQINHFVAVKQDVTERVEWEEKIKHLYVSEREQRELAEALYEVSTRLGATLEVEGVLDSLLDQIRRVVPYVTGSLMLMSGDEVRIVRHRGYEQIGEDTLRQIASLTFSLQSTPNLRRMAASGRPLVVSDTHQDPDWVVLPNTDHIRSWVGAPVASRGKVIGFISLDHTKVGYFSPEHARYLAAFAGQAALAIQNARLFEQERRRIETLQALQATVSDITAELELPNLLRAILERAYGLIGAAGGELGLYDEGAQVVEIVASNYLGRDYSGLQLPLGEGAMGHVAQTRQPVIIDDYFNWEGHSDKFREVPIHAVMAAPLLAGNRLVGVISLADPTEGKSFSAMDLELLSLFAQQAAVAVENARLYEAARRRAREAETLRQVSAAVTESLHQEEAIARILEELLRVVPYDSASVQLLRDGYLEVVGGRGWPDLNEVLGLRFPVPGENPNTAVIESRQPLILENADFSHLPDSEHIRSWLGVPLVLRDTVIGMVTLDSVTPGHFSGDHARLATAFADQVALALENTRLFEGERRRAEELAVLHAIAVASAEAQDEDDLLERATRVIGETLFPDVFGVMLLNEAAGELRPHASYRLPPGVDPEISLSVGQGISGQVATDGQARRIADVRTYPDYVEWVEGIRSELCVPLKIGERVIGVVNAKSLRENAFTSTDERLLSTLSGQLASGIERTRLYQAAVRAAERRAVLYRASREIGASLQPDQIYQAIHRAAEQLMPFDVFVISLLDESRGEIEAPYLFERGRRYPSRRIPADQGLSGYVIASGETLLTGDFDQTHAGQINRHFFGDTPDHAASVLAVPMRLGAEVIGMLSLQSFHKGAYASEDQETLELMASQAAIALNNARLYVDSRRQVEELQVLNAVSAAAAEATSVDALIEKATELIGTQLYPDNFGILLMDKTRRVLEVHPSYRGLPETVREQALATEIPLGKGVSGAVAARGEPRRIPDVSQEPSYLAVVSGMRSELCVPIKVGDRVLGVINAESARVDAFAPGDEQLLLTFAGQLATAIEKVRLFEEVQKLAITDSLTQQYNRRHLFDLAEREFQRARRYQRHLAVIMLDLDRFKRVNDTYGHAVGDQVLQAVALRCRHELRKIDSLGRYGGEEFVALLPECLIGDAQVVAERLCQAVSGMEIDTQGGPLHLTISLGVSALDESCKDLDELFRRADRALYEAKQSGRNRVCVYKGD